MKPAGMPVFYLPKLPSADPIWIEVQRACDRIPLAFPICRLFFRRFDRIPLPYPISSMIFPGSDRSLFEILHHKPDFAVEHAVTHRLHFHLDILIADVEDLAFQLDRLVDLHELQVGHGQ